MSAGASRASCMTRPASRSRASWWGFGPLGTSPESRRLARGLHPAVLDDKGLVAAARRHVNDFAKSFGMAIDLRVEGAISRRLSPLVQTTMYRILQEALTNVARHAQARAVGVVLKHDG